MRTRLPSQETGQTEIIKSKFQVLRMIHRVSSPYFRIGYTVGDGDDFTDDTASAFMGNIFGTALMFLNAKNSSLRTA